MPCSKFFFGFAFLLKWWIKKKQNPTVDGFRGSVTQIPPHKVHEPRKKTFLLSVKYWLVNRDPPGSSE